MVGLSPTGTAARLVALLRCARPPTELLVFLHRAYLQAPGVDKKKREAQIRFVALRGIGSASSAGFQLMSDKIDYVK
jgi:3-dehydroquinate synthetase